MKRFHALLTLVLVTDVAIAGDLNPPAGPIGATQPVVLNSIDVEDLPAGGGCLHAITASGSYHLTRSITGSSGLGGISIQASYVTLDLRGFELIGVAGSLDGVSGDLANNRKGIVVRNGSIHNWGNQAIDLGNTTTYSGVIEDIRACDNAGIGIGTGVAYVVRNCVASGNGGVGIWLSSGSTITGSDSSQNVSDGFFLNIGSTIQECTAYQNVGNGIQITAGCRVNGNNCRENGYGAGTGSGILAGNANGSGGNRIESNNCSGADFGIRVTSTNNWIVGNTCNSNTTNWFANATPNAVATILDLRSAPLTPINGNSGGNLDYGCCYNFSY